MTTVEENPVRNTMSDKTRYIIIGVVSVCLLALIIVLIVFGGNESGKKRNLSTETLVEFYDEFDSKDLNVIYFASATCGYCAMETPILENIAKDYDMHYYDIDASTLSEVELNEIINALGISGSTPTTVIVQDGKVVATQNGMLDGKLYIKFFSSNGLIPEDAVYNQETKLVDSNYEDFKILTEDSKKSLVLLDVNGCSACIAARTVLNDLATENNFVVSYLNAAYLSEDESNSLVTTDLKKMGYDEESYVDGGDVSVPLFLVVGDGKIYDYLLESTEESDYTKVLKKYNFIK